MPTETGWAIAHRSHGLYVGWWMTRKAAISQHVSDCWSGRDGFGEISPFAIGGLSKDQTRAWGLSRKAGDRVVKVTLTYRRRK